MLDRYGARASPPPLSVCRFRAASTAAGFLCPLARVALEFHSRGGLVETDAAGDDLGTGVALRRDGCACHSAEHRELPDVPQRVRERTLDQLLE